MNRSLIAFLIGLLLSACSGGGSRSSSGDTVNNANDEDRFVSSDFSGIRLTWKTPTLREDGSLLEEGEVIGYAIRIQSRYGNYSGPEVVYLYSANENFYEFNISADSYEFEIATITVHGVGEYSDMVDLVLE